MQDFSKFYQAIGSSDTSNLRGSSTISSDPSASTSATSTDTSTLNSIPTSSSTATTNPDSIFANNSGLSIGEDNSSFLNILNQSGKLGNRSSLIDTGQSSLVYGIISNWYLLVAIPAMTVTYNVFKALQDHGILQALYDEVSTGLKSLVQVSIDCPQYVYDIGLLFQCLGW